MEPPAACPRSRPNPIYMQTPFRPPGKTSSVCHPGCTRSPPRSPAPFGAGGREERRDWAGPGRVIMNAMPVERMPGGHRGYCVYFQEATDCPQPLGTQIHCVHMYSSHPAPPLPQTCSVSLVPYLCRWPTTCPGGGPSLGHIQAASPFSTPRPTAHACCAPSNEVGTLTRCPLRQTPVIVQAQLFQSPSIWSSGLWSCPIQPSHDESQEHSLTIHFNKHLLNDSYVPGTVLGTG